MDYSLSVLTIQGEVILKKQKVPSMLDLSKQPDGIYFIRLLERKTGKTEVQKISKLGL